MSDEEVRPELAELRRRQANLDDDARPDALARRRASGRRTARENLAELVDKDSWVEYGGLTVAGQRARRSAEDLHVATAADGFIGGLATVAGQRVAALSYDYLVLAGTQGVAGHRKTDRLFELIERLRVPAVLFAEGGGGRPGDTDYPMIAGLDLMTFAYWARLSGVVPRIGVVSGRSFAGNASLYGMCDITIAVAGSSIGMGGPAMIEGGGLGVVEPDDVGPLSVQVPNGVVDVEVANDEAAVAAVKLALSYFAGPQPEWTCADQVALRDAIPENRRRAYDVTKLIALLADTGSVLELRPRFARGMVTALARIEGKPVGILANNPKFMAGAITSDGADKAARFLQLCDAHSLPVLTLCDTPGIMVGPEAEATGLVRHSSRLFVAGANLTVPVMTIVLRKAYGLGAMAMAAGSFHNTLATFAWPTGEIGPMGLEGAVKLALRKELAAIEDEEQRAATLDAFVAMAYEQGKALSAATFFELDDVIDPADTRAKVAAVLLATHIDPNRTRRAYLDTW